MPKGERNGEKEYFPSTSGKEPAEKTPEEIISGHPSKKDEGPHLGKSGWGRIRVFSRS
jgi:hypothetical protein